ncbi:phage N-6-adenine-methyltransferase [Oceanimonas sp. NS1]|nr:phage N-6-adenine-methyltransferase [Oceanimonas sp. NS1]
MSKDCWGTPLPVYLPLDEEFNFQADLCASERNAKHPYYLTEADDALSDMAPARLQLSVPAGGCMVQPALFRHWSVGRACHHAAARWHWHRHAGDGRHLGGLVLPSICSAAARSAKSWLVGWRSSMPSGEPVGGSNKGSLLLIFDPFGRPGIPRRSYVTRAELLDRGFTLMTEPEHLMALYAKPQPLCVEHSPECGSCAVTYGA